MLYFNLFFCIETQNESMIEQKMDGKKIERFGINMVLLNSERRKSTNKKKINFIAAYNLIYIYNCNIVFLFFIFFM